MYSNGHSNLRLGARYKFIKDNRQIVQNKNIKHEQFSYHVSSIKPLESSKNSKYFFQITKS